MSCALIYGPQRLSYVFLVNYVPKFQISSSPFGPVFCPLHLMIPRIISGNQDRKVTRNLTCDARTTPLHCVVQLRIDRPDDGTLCFVLKYDDDLNLTCWSFDVIRRPMVIDSLFQKLRQICKSGRLDFGRMDCWTVVNFGLLDLLIITVQEVLCYYQN